MASTALILYFVSFVFGAIFGNFATTFIHRIPLKKKLYGRSEGKKGLPPHCASCGAKLKLFEYMPIVGFLKNLGRCLHCKAKIPIIYPITEFFSAIAGICTFHYVGMNYKFIYLLLALVIAYTTLIILITSARNAKTEL